MSKCKQVMAGAVFQTESPVHTLSVGFRYAATYGYGNVVFQTKYKPTESNMYCWFGDVLTPNSAQTIALATAIKNHRGSKMRSLRLLREENLTTECTEEAEK